jgi:protein-disulfide isomerase
MTRPLNLGIIFGLILTAAVTALIVQSTQIRNFAQRSEQERSALRAEIRSYILENPRIIFEAVAIVRQQEEEAEAGLDDKLVQDFKKDLFEDGYSYVGGNLEGDITVIEFLDYRCGYCRKAFEEVEALLSEDGNIRFIIKEYPILGEASILTSQFAIAIKQLHGNDAYKMIYDTLIAFSGEPTPESLGEIARTFGFEIDPIFERMMSDEVLSEINANRVLGEKMQISGTPTFVFENKLLRGFVPLETMRALAASQRG